MKTKLLVGLLLAGSSLFAETHVSIGIGLGGGYGGYYAPYPPPVYAYAPPYPGPGYSWIDGYWFGFGPSRAWRPGYWARPSYGYGGYYRGSSVLISGLAGTGKSTFSAWFANAACGRHEVTLGVLLIHGRMPGVLRTGRLAH